jgi:hypothetical protein
LLARGTLVTSGHDVTRCHNVNKNDHDDGDDATIRDGDDDEGRDGLGRWCIHLPA